MNELRENGLQIAPCTEEKEKYTNILNKGRNINDIVNIYQIIDTYSKRPTDFEKFCANLFCELGYEADVTPPTNDGGYDIVLRQNGKIQAIVECKCFSTENHVGRPMVQKLVGATTPIKCNRCIFITTSTFTSAAQKYAEEVGVVLIDGQKLISIIYKLKNKKKDESLNIQQIWLTQKDLEQHIPSDIDW